MATEIKETMEGKWIVYKSENFEKYLDALGVGTIKKKLACSLNPKLKLLVTGDVISASLSAGPKKNKTSFKLGEEYEVDANDVPSTAISTWRDKKLRTVITPKDLKRKEQVVEREIVDGEMIQCMGKIVVKADSVELHVTIHRKSLNPIHIIHGYKTMTVEGVTARRFFKKRSDLEK